MSKVEMPHSCMFCVYFDKHYCKRKNEFTETYESCGKWKQKEEQTNADFSDR